VGKKKENVSITRGEEKKAKGPSVKCRKKRERLKRGYILDFLGKKKKNP